MKECKQCGGNFEVTVEDRGFYQLMEVNEPTLCYFCRAVRRLSYRNERFLYERKCDLTGGNIISSFSVNKLFPVYGIEAWWSDDWDALDYGVDFDFNRPFFEQFFELLNRVPRMALQQQNPMWNSEYCNCASQNRNCYLVFSTNKCEDCYYGSWVNQSKNCVDNNNINDCELCYECTGCRECYGLKYSQDCVNCNDSYFLRECSGCTSCFGCTNLHNKQYCIFNQQKSKEEYQDFIKRVDLGSRKLIDQGKEKARAMLKDLKVKEFHGVRIENSFGEHLRDCKNVYMGFECDNCEDVRYSICLADAKTSMDHSYWGGNSERTYECQACGYDLYNLRFCNLCWTGCSDLTYCDLMFSSKNCFGCIGLKKMEYCILNKKYTPEEYKKLMEKIVDHMKKTGEWGEFFPVEKSIYAYNETLAWEMNPLTREQVLERNWPWQEKDEREYQHQSYEAPDNIKDVDKSVIKELLACEDCGKNYKIVTSELEFYKSQTIPLPRKCPDCRHYKRLKLRTPRKFWQRHCEKCQKPIKTPYSPERPEKVYCEKCYLEEVY